jgi:hypothetical protein
LQVELQATTTNAAAAAAAAGGEGGAAARDGQQPQPQRVIDEVKTYLEGRYVSSSEASWRIFALPMHDRSHSVVRLDLHLPEDEYVIFNQQDDLRRVAARGPPVTTLTAWFQLNRQDPEARNLLYIDVVERYRWHQKAWKKRSRPVKVVGRVRACSPSEGERYFLRMLLHHVPGGVALLSLQTLCCACKL